MTPADQQSANDCARACVASIFDLPIADVPHFVEVAGSRWRLELMAWLKATRPEFVMVELPWPVRSAWLEGAVGIACGKSPRHPDGKIRHAVVWQEYGMAHDPHPSRAGLTGEPETVIYFTKGIFTK